MLQRVDQIEFEVHVPVYITVKCIWAVLRQNLSSGFLTKRVSNQSPQLQRLARRLKYHL